MPHSVNRVAIVGGGASGLAAAVTAARTFASARRDADIVILERQPRVGRKLLATGNGRCNLSNRHVAPDFYHTVHPEWLSSILRRFGAEDTIKFFREQHLLCRTEEGGRIYPYNGQASAVLDSLRFAAARRGVQVITGCDVQQIHRRRASFLLTLPNGQPLETGAVIIAAGSKAAPQLGGSDGGLTLLSAFGHPITPLAPALCPATTDPALIRPLKGVRVRGVVSLRRDGQTIRREAGEIQFTERGISGIAAMQMARFIGVQPAGCALSLDLMPDYAHADAAALLGAAIREAPREPIENLLSGMLHRRAAQALLKRAGFSPTQPAADMPKGCAETLARTVKAFNFPVTGLSGWRDAQVMAGGADVDAFDAQTLASRLVPGLFAAGEVLDVDGDCGGFNLHFAWASGILAGKAAAQSLLGGEVSPHADSH